MNEVLKILSNWSEVWALLIPLTIILVYKPKGEKTGWLKMYVIAALLINTLVTVMAEFYGSMPSWLKNNNILYNIHSVIRVIFFSSYILSVRPYRYLLFLKGLLLFYLVFVAIDFTIIESPFYISSNIFSAESIVMILLCILYFFRSIDDDSEIQWLKQPSFLVCTGILFYEMSTFFYYLFFNTLNYSEKHRDINLAWILQIIYAISFVVLCVLLAAALYKSRKDKPATTR